MIFAENFRQLRIERGYSQSDVAKKLRLTQPFISAIETGTTNLTIERMSVLSRFLGVPLHQLLTPR